MCIRDRGRSVLSVVPLFCSAGCDADGILWGRCDDSSVFLRPKVMQDAAAWPPRSRAERASVQPFGCCWLRQPNGCNITRHHSPECVQGGAKIFTVKWDERRSCRGALFCLLFLCSAPPVAMPMGSCGGAVMIHLFSSAPKSCRMGVCAAAWPPQSHAESATVQPFGCCWLRPNGCTVADSA